MKVATNIVTAATAQVAAEALALVRKAGMPAELFGRAMKSNASNSTTLEMKLPMMLEGDFEPHFSVKHMLKDVRIASKLAEEFGLDLPVTEAASDVLLDELKQGRGDADYSSVAQKYFPAPEKFVRPARNNRNRPETANRAGRGESRRPCDRRRGEAVKSRNRNNEKEIPEGVNLSGGIRSWFRRRT